MKKRLAILASCLATFGGLAALPSAAEAGSFVGAGSCAWNTTGATGYSPTWGVYFAYMGHTWINGHNYRHFFVWNGGATADWYVYCG